MPNREDILRDETFKGEVEGIDTRMYYTLSKKPKSQEYRNSKAIASLISVLHGKRIMTDTELDDLLLGLTQ